MLFHLLRNRSGKDGLESYRVFTNRLGFPQSRKIQLILKRVNCVSTWLD